MRTSNNPVMRALLLALVATVVTGCPSARPQVVRVPSGESITIPGPVIVLNLCAELHVFDYTTDHPEFVSFVKKPPLEVPPSDLRHVDSVFDASDREAGEYDATITVECTDCPSAMAGCTQDRREIPVRMTVYDPILNARLHIYSGRADPGFRISDRASITRLRTLFQAAVSNPSFQEQYVMPGHLGYNGISIEVPTDYPGLPRILIVYREQVQGLDPVFEESAFFIDHGGQMESFLLDLAVESGAISDRMRRAILAAGT